MNELPTFLLEKSSPYVMPIGAGLVAALLAHLGWQRLGIETVRINIGKRRDSSELIQVLNGLLILVVSTSLVFLITTSREIAISIGLLLTCIPFLLARRRSAALKRKREKSWPEAIDGIVSSINAGQSIIEAMSEVGKHGPALLRPYFQKMSDDLREEKPFPEVIQLAMSRLDCAVADQVLIVLLFAKEFGGRDVTSTLRLLASFLRDNSQAREEVETRFGWVRNSALLGAVSPWLLLSLLSMQPKTVAAYETSTGRIVLSIGIISTAIAFLWMGRVSRLPESPRAYIKIPDLSEEVRTR